MLNSYYQTQSTVTLNVCCAFLRHIAIHEIALRAYRNILLRIIFAAALEIFWTTKRHKYLLCVLSMPETSLRMVTTGRDFVVSLFIGKNIAEDQKKKKKKFLTTKRVGFQFESIVVTKKKVLYLSISGFLVWKEKTNGVTPKWWHPGRAALPPIPHNDATGKCAWLLKTNNVFFSNQKHTP